MRKVDIKYFSYLFLLQILATLAFWREVEGDNKGTSDSCFLSNCPFWEFQCSSGGCVNMAKFCDGRVDCTDGSDEIMWEEKGDVSSILLTHIACINLENNFNLTCALPNKYACDSIPQCVNKTDESKTVCEKNHSNRYMKQCHAHEWCMNDKVLDQCEGCEDVTKDCDGQFCAYSGTDPDHDCASYIFRCANGKCLRAEQYCDGVNDCEDGSDEMTDVTSDEGTLCKNKWNYVDLQCILPQRYLCDGINHCENRTDECDGSCQYSFICDNDKCISSGFQKSAPALVGDGRDNCGDSSDEINAFGDILSSVNSHFRCNKDSNTTIPAEKFCDGRIDCPKGEDEVYSTNSTDLLTCTNKLVALNLTCVVSNHHMCDDVALCANFEDEMGCGYDDDYYQCPGGETVRNSASVICNFHVDCCDDHDECAPEHNCSSTFTCLSDGKCLAFQRFCDGIVDCADGSDEKTDSASFNGVLCDNIYNLHESKCLLPKAYQCDGVDHCRARLDECKYGCDKSFFCQISYECIARSNFCDGEVNCEDGSDEKMTGAGFKCAVKNEEQGDLKTCVLPQSMLIDSVTDCDDMSDKCTVEGACFRCATHDVSISANQVCDGIFDCPDLSDECLCEDGRLSSKTSEICHNFHISKDSSAIAGYCDFGKVSCDSGRKCIDTFQLCDDVEDCEDESDEKACSKSVIRNAATNVSHFECTLFNFENLNAVKCDGVPQCSDFSDECSTTQLPNSNITEETSSSSDGKIDFQCGSRTLKICTELAIDKFHLYHCPKSKIPLFPPEICNGIEDCVGNVSSGNQSGVKIMGRHWSQLSVDEKYCNDRFLCHKSHPIDARIVTIPRSQVCDGTVNCFLEEDETEVVEIRKVPCSYDEKLFILSRESDEMLDRTNPDSVGSVEQRFFMFSNPLEKFSTCQNPPSCELCQNMTTRFYCEEHQQNTEYQNHFNKDPLFVPIHLMFDGNEDCSDGSDECPSDQFDENPFSSRHRMIKDTFLSGLVWIMAFAALVGNSFVIWHNLRRLKKEQRLSPMMKTNCVLILNLAAADFLMGVYLLALAVQNVHTEGEYCKYDKEWRASISCKLLGTVAMISSQCSVLVLLILTTYRVMTVLKPFSANLIQGRYTGIFLTGAWTLATIVAILPHLVALEDYFVSSAWLSSSVNLFDTNTPNKKSLQLFGKQLQAFHAIKHDFQNTSLLTGDISWSTIRQSIKNYYPNFWPPLTINGYFGFYGSNSVCLPQIFVTTDINSWVYSVVVVAFDLCSCFYIALSYLVVYYDAKRVVTNNQKEDENKIMQTRITRLVLTDFACWLPICVIAILSLTGVFVSPTTYTFAAIVLLPINSALNPILYSNTFSHLYNFCIKPCSSFLWKRASHRRESLNQSRHRSNYSRTSFVASATFNDLPQSAESVPMILFNSEPSQIQNPIK